MTPEKIVQNAVIKHLDLMIKQGEKLIYFRREAIGQAYKKGIPDIYGSLNGKHIEIECKREAGGQLSPMQVKFRAKMESIGVSYCAPTSIEEFVEFIEEVKRNG
ncbi:MAG: hypothetical protein K6D97_08670 [Clostridia bacterium]|nr:hypothetical protein [Clostridia bacterium]